MSDELDPSVCGELPPPALDSCLILEKARILWSTSRQEWRDIRVEVGRLLQKWIIQMAVESEKALYMPEYRREPGYQRHYLVKRAAVVLDITTAQVQKLLRVANVVDLLAERDEAGDPLLGTLTFSSLELFQSMIERPPGEAVRTRRSINLGTNLGSYDGRPRLSFADKERWRVREPVVQNVEFFRSCVREEWCWDEIRSRIPKIRPRSGTKAAKLEEFGSVLGLKDAISVSSSRDAAEVLYQVVLCSQQPVDVARRLLEMVEAEARKPKRIVL